MQSTNNKWESVSVFEIGCFINCAALNIFNIYFCNLFSITAFEHINKQNPELFALLKRKERESCSQAGVYQAFAFSCQTQQGKSKHLKYLLVTFLRRCWRRQLGTWAEPLFVICAPVMARHTKAEQAMRRQGRWATTSDEEYANEGEKRRKEDGNSQGTMNRIQTSGRRATGQKGAINMRGGRIHSVWC